MNKFTLTIAFILSNLLIIAQCDDSCLPEGITFTTQEEIDNFQTNYPGCTEIEGDVQINAWNNNFPVTDLSGLSVLTSIGGDLIIAGNDSLTSLAGLDNITSIGGNLGIGYFFGWEAFGNYSLNSLNSLENITSIGGDLVIILNYSLLSLSGLENLTFVPGNLRIEDNNTLTSLADLENLTSVGGSLSIFANPALSNLIGLENLTSIEEDFSLNYNVSLINLNGLENLTSVDGSFYIGENVLLTNLIGLVNLESIGTILNIVSNNNLTSLTGLENLETISGNLRIYNNNSLLNFNGLENLTSIGGSLGIQENPSLTSIASLENLSMIGSLNISDNSALSMCAIESICDYLTSPNGAVYIYNNAPGCSSIQQVQDSCNITSVEKEKINSGLTISSNPTSDQAILSLNLSTSASVNIWLCNTAGFCLKSWQFSNEQPGNRELILDLKETQAGIYFCRVQVGNEMVTKKIIKL